MTTKHFRKTRLRSLALAAMMGLGLLTAARATVPTVADVRAPLLPLAPAVYTLVGGSVFITVSFNTAVNVDTSAGTPTLELETSAGQTSQLNAQAQYIGGSGTTTLSFIYTVTVGDTSDDLEYAFAGLRVGQSLITSVNTGDVYNSLTGIPFPGTTGSLGFNHNIKVQTQRLSLTTVSPVNEGNTVVWTVSRSGSTTDSLFVDLSSSDPSVASVDTSVLIPAGSSAANFNVTGVSDGLASITVDANAYDPVSANITVDDVVLDLTLSGANAIDEGDTATWNVTRNGPVGNSLNVILGSSAPGIAVPEPNVVILSGEATATLEVNGLSDGTATITASATGYNSGAKVLAVRDVPRVLTLSGQSWVNEGSAVTWTVRRTGDTQAALTVSLSSSATGRATVPLNVLISAGSDAAVFSVAGVDGNGTANISATASGYDAASQLIDVRNVLPIVTPAVPSGGLVCDNLSFSYQASDVAGDPITGTWNFGDGTIVGGQAPSPNTTSHRYLTDGSFTVILTVNDGDGGTVAVSFNIVITPAFTLTVDVLPQGYEGLDGVGLGTYSLNPSPTICGTYNPGQVVTITPIPDTGSPRSFMYEWGGSLMDPAQAFNTNNLTVTMDQDRIITILFSREFQAGEGVGDVDHDHLFDGWEITYTLDPRSVQGDDGNGGNPDGDLLPGQPGNYAYAQPPANLNQGALAPSVNDPFVNFIEEAGFDGILFSADDPGTDPRNADTDGDGLGDGWEYFFWGNAINDSNMVGYAYDPATVTGSIEIANATIIGTFAPLVGGAAEADTDADGLQNVEEQFLGTNPIHWDTDGDGLPDGWEVFRNLLPLNPDDADDNPDDDWMARDGSNNIHSVVYDTLGFDPRTAWHDTYQDRDGATIGQTNTVNYSTLDEFLVALYFIQQGLVASVPSDDWDDFTTDPNTPDTDGDGIADGWELYVGTPPVGPNSGDHAGQDGDGDGLTDMQEFRCQEVGANFGGIFPVVFPAWLNKFWPTDPNDEDTDADQLPDGQQTINGRLMGERIMFVYGGGGVNEFRCYAGGGMNPCTADTDGDFLPDFWEADFDSVMDGTIEDAVGPEYDYDADGLENYQEYLVGAVYHFQYSEFYEPYWERGGGLGEYDPWDFFEGNPYRWDWNYWACEGSMEYHFILAKARDGLHFAGTHPERSDTDWDEMDDFYELYHALNPIFGTLDIVHGPNRLAYVPFRLDIREFPWEIGSQVSDPDQDGLVTDKESLQPDHVDPAYYHTDPTPHWLTDHSYQLSWANLYYSLDTMVWYWSQTPGLIYRCNILRPTYMFSFEMNEGYDTDNDNIADGPEAVGSESPGATDPLEMESPGRRHALYLNGNAAARTRGQFYHGSTAMENWTVELWVRPEIAARGVSQVLIERPFELPANNPAGAPPDTIRLNFRLGLDPEGKPFAEYDGSGYDPDTVNPRVVGSTVLPDNTWTHLAASYDGGLNWLILYVNGVRVAHEPSSLIPANGWYEGNPGYAFSGPIVIGARDRNPSGYVGSSLPIWTGPAAGLYPGGAASPNEPVLDTFFQGWIDEVRIWDGARTTTEIQDTMGREMTRDIAAQVTPVGVWPRLLYTYSFDDLGDPDHEPVAPEGFDRLNGFPADGSYPHVPWWGTAPDRSQVYVEYRYVPWLENTVAHLPLVPPADSEITEPVPNTSNPYGFAYYTGTTGGEHPDFFGGDIVGGTREVSTFSDLLPLREAEIDADIEMWDGLGKGTDAADTDGDGLPDAWETFFGLDKNDPTGDNGKWGDADGDGLDNWGEFLAGTSPNVYDTDGDGFSDYDSRTNTASLTFGEQFDDGDGMASAWEVQFGFDPRSYDADDDPDGDGWCNYSEFLAGASPIAPNEYPEPAVNFIIRYNGVNEDGNIIVDCFNRSSMDGAPDATYNPTGRGLLGILGEQIAVAGPAALSGTFNYANLYPGSVAITIGSSGFTDNGLGGLIGTIPGSGGTVNYDTGDWTLTFTGTTPATGLPVLANYAFFNLSEVDFPLFASFTSASDGHLREGDNWFFAFIDRDGDRAWSEGEPAGLAEYQPVRVEFGLLEVEIGLTDKMVGVPDDTPGSGRFAWPAVDGAPSYDVRIRRNTSGEEGDSPLVVERNVLAGPLMAPRNFFHEGDILHEGMLLGLPSGDSEGPSFEWKVGEGTAVPRGTVYFSWPPPDAPPQLVSPVGAILRHGQNPFRWIMDDHASGFRMQITPGSPGNTPLLDDVFRAPFRREGTSFAYEFLPPIYGGDLEFPDGIYHWRVQRLDPHNDGANGLWWSDWASFTLDTDEDIAGPYSISGMLAYFGPVDNVAEGEVLGDGNGVRRTFLGTLRHAPVMPGTFSPGTATTTFTDNGDGSLTGSGGATGLIDYETGAWLLTFAAAPDATQRILADYEHFANRFVVQAFESLGFGGTALAQATLMAPGPYELRGLRAGTYYVRGFMDQNGNNEWDSFEAFGFAKVTRTADASDYAARAFPVLDATGGFDDGHLTIRDRDTDGDGRADSLEYVLYGGLTAYPGGILEVDVSPETASWLVTSYPDAFGGPFAGAGDFEVNAAPGSYTVAFDPLTGYVTPSPVSRNIAAGETEVFSGVYARQPATLVIDVTPDTASWTLTAYPAGYAGATSGTGDFQTTTDAEGSCTVTYEELGGYAAPSQETLTLTSAQTTTFVGTYVPYVNLVAPANGGALDSFTSQFATWLGQASKLTDGKRGDISVAWSSARSPGVQEFVYSFDGGQDAVVNHVVIYNYSLLWEIFQTNPAYLSLSMYSRNIEVFVSADGVNFSPAASGELKANLKAQRFELGDVTAKKIKLRVKTGYGIPAWQLMFGTDLWQLGEFETYGYLGGVPVPEEAEAEAVVEAEPGVDSDGDGLTDADEFRAGTSPYSAASALRITGVNRSGDGGFVVRWQSVSGKQYAVDVALDLLEEFGVVESGIEATPPENTYTDQVERTSPVYYRIRLEE